MKLSKLTLEWLIYHALHSDVAGYTEFKIIKEIDEAFEDGTLEIEGYEQSKWTRFDPKDESTYPPKGKFLAYGGFECEPQGIFFGLSYDNKSTRIAYGKVLKYWRPLPKPPQETEGKDCK